MKVMRTDPLTGKENTLEIPVTEAQINKWRGGRNIQDVMRNLTDDQREFMMTGLLPKSWEEIFKGQNDEDLEVDKGI